MVSFGVFYTHVCTALLEVSEALYLCQPISVSRWVASWPLPLFVQTSAGPLFADVMFAVSSRRDQRETGGKASWTCIDCRWNPPLRSYTVELITWKLLLHILLERLINVFLCAIMWDVDGSLIANGDLSSEQWKIEHIYIHLHAFRSFGRRFHLTRLTNSEINVSDKYSRHVWNPPNVLLLLDFFFS